MSRLLTLSCWLLAVPVLGVLGAWLHPDAGSLAVLAHQLDTVLPGYLRNSAVLALSVALGVALLGSLTAALVSLFDFPGRRLFEWALLLPMAMPAYVLAYAATDFLQTSGPLQTLLRGWTGAQGALWPDVRSLWGATAMFVLCLYPYVYLLTRAALSERARLLGAGSARRVREVALPLARPAIAAGVALALMETLSDYGVGAYFGLQTLATGVYKAWLVMNDRDAAAQLASLLLVVAPARRRGGRGRACLRAAGAARLRAAGGRAAAPRVAGGPGQRDRVAGGAAVGALPALGLEQLQARRAGRAERQRQRGALGYAVPGAVVAIGILLPVGWVQQRWPEAGAAALVTGTLFGVVYAYLVRFSAVALQSVEAGYARLNPHLDESARMLGASRRRIFAEVHAPLLRRAALGAMLLVFVDVMKELPATLVLRPFDSDTLAVVAYQLARDERLAEAALPSLAIVLVGLAPVLLLSRSLRRD
ncbi:iron ABC transporter permease [Piscinibacter sakaiensis]|uniref:ABC transporter permease n=1 Tax=Piscinibacter sakaiensis TaxID=1547922 RepID=UPI0037263365